MKRDDLDELPPEVDFSSAARGRHVERFSAERRAERLGRAWPAMVRELSGHTLSEVRELEAALFAFFILAQHESVGRAARHAAALLDATKAPRLDEKMCGLADRSLLARVQGVAAQREWIQQPIVLPDEGRESLEPILQRLRSVYDEVQAIRQRIERLMEEHLAGTGLSPGEIERKTEEAAKLWRAA